MKTWYRVLLVVGFALTIVVQGGCSREILRADEPDYEALWQEVEGYRNKGLPKSALEVVEKIYQRAKESEHAAEFIKAVMHKLRFYLEVEEETFFKAYRQLSDELKTSRFPVTPLLHSMLAEQLWHYYQQNRYRFLQRSAGAVQDDDMRTWDLRMIVQEVVGHYKKSLEDAKQSKAVNIDIYDKILYDGRSGRVYRPTLYDFLAHRAVDFFMRSEAGITQPVYRFNLGKKEYLAPTREFAGLDISSKDPLSFHFHALSILQELVKFHLEDKSPDALLDVDLKRLRLVHREAVIDNKDARCEETLRQMIDEYEGKPAAAEIYCELADLYNRLGDNYRPSHLEREKKEEQEFKWHKRKAHDLCEKAVGKYPDSSGARRCTNLVRKIEAKTLALTLEKAVVPGQPSLGLVRYRNLDRLRFRVVKTDRQEIENARKLSNDKLVALFLAKKADKEWQVAFPGDGDFQTHTAEFKIDALPVGSYILLASNSKDFDFKTHAVAYSFFNVTDIAYVQRQEEQGALEFFLRHRDTGEPLADAQAQTWYRLYDRPSRRYVLKKGPVYRTDSAGFFHIPWNPAKRSSFQLEFIHGSDRLYLERNFYLYKPYERTTRGTRTFFFTDRSIYRPGQTVYFKGIMLHVDGKEGAKSRILPNRQSRVVIYDVNRQKVAELLLTANEYGTFSGTFQLPRGRLNGNWTISDGRGSTFFSVEEYKRPKFYAAFQPAKKSYKLNDTVTVRGKAAAYAGYAVDNAAVRFRVVRRVFYPYRWYHWYYTPPAPEMEIVNGTTTTDAKGEFAVTFKAVPDTTVSRKYLPAFRFTVSAEVTDINGETREASKSIAVGYTALKLGMTLPDELDRDSGRYSLTLSSTTLSGDFVPAAGTVAFYRLQENRRLTREKRWPVPDRFTMDEKEYRRLFPYDNCTDEGNFSSWEKGKAIFDADFDTGKSRKLALADLSRWPTGKYVMEMAARDKSGQTVKEVRYFTLYSSSAKRMPYTMPGWFTVPKGTVEPGDKALILVGSSANDVRAVFEIEQYGKIVERKYIRLENEQKRIEIPIRETHRGNLSVHFTFIKHNRLFRESRDIVVPWTNKDLDIGFETFRDQLTPGQKEEWRIRIRARKGGEKVQAEMVAALYDASLDAFRPHHWGFPVFPFHGQRCQWLTNPYFDTVDSRYIGRLQEPLLYVEHHYDRLNWFGFYPGSYWGYDSIKQKAMAARPAPLPISAGEAEEDDAREGRREGKKRNGGKQEPDSGVLGGVLKEEIAVAAEEKPAAEQTDLSGVKARTQFQETAFFYPHLATDKDGAIVVAFTVPEALTRWKMLGFAHTKELQYGLTTNQLVTQKELMVVPNVPRFMREGDTVVISSKITNLAEKELSGTAKLFLFDAATMQPVDVRFKNDRPQKSFTAGKGQSGRVAWTIRIPEGIDALTYRIVAKAGNFSDGEEQALPILTNRMLVTESLPLPVRGSQSKEFTFKKLVDAGKSDTLRHHKLTLEFTANPAWYAVQALPYLMEYPYECLEQTFSRFYANTIASHIANANPKIKRVFDLWKSGESKDALLSNLEKNQELKSLLLEETPWVLDAQNETERKRRIALLFDLDRMAGEKARALRKLKEGQLASGAWPWFFGMIESRYITQHIVCGFAHLERLQVIDAQKNQTIRAMLKEAVPYLDRKIKEDYDWLVRRKADLELMHIGYIQVHYLYARSYFRDIPMDDSIKKAFDYYKGQAETYWLKFNKYLQGMIALALNRCKNPQKAKEIAASIKEHALHSEEMGMYWKEGYGFYWYQAPIETQALLIEVFSEILDDRQSVDDMRTWLLKQKQTQDWRTTKATAAACYALLLRGSEWLEESAPPDITLGKRNKIKIEPAKMDGVKVEAGTGYFKTAWAGSDVVPDMGYVAVKNNNKVAAWGALYWQYFENQDKITPAKTPLHLKKQLFIETPSDTGPKLVAIKKRKPKVGDKIKVRIELRVDRAMEFVHMKDMRASGFEPINVLSRCKWQDGLCYYESTKDASTNFFIDYLPKGVYVFEYPLRVSHAGDFSNGITTIQCMYAPEFASHSEGIRVTID